VHKGGIYIDDVVTRQKLEKRSVSGRQEMVIVDDSVFTNVKAASDNQCRSLSITPKGKRVTVFTAANLQIHTLHNAAPLAGRVQRGTEQDLGLSGLASHTGSPPVVAWRWLACHDGA